jgi:glycosyltransferase involved in cell wall biosynthesis
VTSGPSSRVAVVIPCHDEEVAVGKVVADFRRELPQARIVVVDNASRDATRERALQAGAEVLSETRKGKGFALLRGFSSVPEADLVVMVDGDDTYPAEEVRTLLQAAEGGADMVIGTRLSSFDAKAYRPGHTLGNRIFVVLVRVLFGVRTQDLFSGYRVLSRRFLDASPLIAQGFEIETELSLQALSGKFPVSEVPIHYRARPENSVSKLRTFRDGYRILIALFTFFRDYRPLTFFGLVGLLFLLLGAVAGAVVVTQYLETGRVYRIPLAVLSVGLTMLGAMCFIAGTLLSSISRRASELAAILARRR